MKRYFFTSDIHSFYTPLMTGLAKAGFDRLNPEHILVVLGDVFDRGTETLEVYNFLRSIPDDRLFLIRGNHEILYLELLDKHFPESHDFHNGTVKTFCQIAGFNAEVLTYEYWFKQARQDGVEVWEYSSRPYEYWQQIKEIVNESPVTAWLKSDRWVNYLEFPKYVCVHAWVPLHYRFTYYGYIEADGVREDWKNATQTEWDDATWGCPWSYAKEKWNCTGKYIMCGHWHTSDFFNNLTKQKKSREQNPVFISKRYKLVGLDACTVLSNKVNILVLTEEEV